MVELPEIDEELEQPEEKKVKETINTAVKFAFLGAGQGGGNLADAFYELGYRRVAVVNTTERDMQRLAVPVENRLVYVNSTGGAGKNPQVGEQLAKENYEEIFKLLQSSFGGDAEQILICVGLGGGTGTGSVQTLVRLCKEYLSSIGGKDVEKKVGVIATLPTKDESAAVQRNALDALNELVSLAQRKLISPLVLVDNAKVMSLYGQASVVGVWEKANKNIAALFHMFNLLTAVDDKSCIVTCDPQDYRTVLQSGILSFGRTKIKAIQSDTDVADAVRDNVKKGMLVEGLDLSKATAGAGILVASEKNLENVSQQSLEMAFASLNRLMHQGPETKLHRGIYSSKGDGIWLYTILGGLGAPADRIAEMHAKAGGSYPLS